MMGREWLMRLSLLARSSAQASVLLAALLLAAVLLTGGCSSDSPITPASDDGTATVDTSTVTFDYFHTTAYHADGVVKTGLDLQWQIAFHSTQGRDLRIKRYELLDQGGEILHEETDPIPRFIESGRTLPDKWPWVELDAPTAEGSYTFAVAYDLGHLGPDSAGGVVWTGTIATGRIDTTFMVVSP